MQLIRHARVMEKFGLGRAIERLSHEAGLASGSMGQQLLFSLVRRCTTLAVRQFRF